MTDLELVFTEVIERSWPGFRFVEVGAFKGKSTIFAAQLVKSLKKDIEITTVDHFKGSKEHHRKGRGYWTMPKGESLFDHFTKNVARAGVTDAIRVLPISSVKAAAMFDDDSLDFVFIDASHEYKDVHADILAWSPKVSSGGLLAGDDFVPGFPGVVRAVKELIIPVFTRGRIWLNKEKVP